MAWCPGRYLPFCNEIVSSLVSSYIIFQVLTLSEFLGGFGDLLRADNKKKLLQRFLFVRSFVGSFALLSK